MSGEQSDLRLGAEDLAELLGQCCALTLDGRGVPMDYEPAPGCGCAKD